MTRSVISAQMLVLVSVRKYVLNHEEISNTIDSKIILHNYILYYCSEMVLHCHFSIFKVISMLKIEIVKNDQKILTRNSAIRIKLVQSGF